MGRLKFHSRGTGGSVLLCLHGFLGEGSDWAEFADAFLVHAPEWQLALIDLPGHSEENLGWICPSADEFSQSLRDFVAAEGWGTAAIAGYSLGGRLGLQTALSFPEAFPVFIGVSTTAGIDDEAERARRVDSDSALASRLRSGGDFAGFLREWWHQPVFASPARLGDDLERFVTSRQRRDPVRMAACLETWSSGRMPSHWFTLPFYPGRTLMLSGEVDTKYTATAERMQAGFQNAEHMVVPGAGHQLLMEKPQEVARAMAAFLNQYKRSRAAW
jgi:2-succinyl-6-hydroxy-2,4-cyclohexadiene-1-carboxylate synthase